MNSADQSTRICIPVIFKDDESGLFADLAGKLPAARVAQARWSLTPLSQRLKLIRELRRLIAEHAVQLADTSASARRRPALESLTAEVLPLAEACRFLERNAGKILAPRRLGRRGLPLWLARVRSEIRREPCGVVLIIGPANYPLLLPGVQLIQALAAGNAVLLKPGVGATAVTQLLCQLLGRAGFDSQLVTLLPESIEAARAAIAARPDKVIFTGSAETGEKILAQLAPQLIPAALELSGCDAVLILADADLELAAKALSFGLTLNQGATCMSPKRVFISNRRAGELQERLVRVLREHRRISSLYVPSVDEPLSPVLADRLRPLLYDAIARGAEFITGGIDEAGNVSLPVVLADVSTSADLLHTDIFAPVLAIVAVADDEAAVRCVNDCPFALTAGIFSRDESAARSLAARLNAGVVTINDLIVPTADARLPFGGRGRSGFGATRGAEGLLELTVAKAITVSRGGFRPAFDPPQPGDEEMFKAYLNLTHGRGVKTRWPALISLLQGVIRRGKMPTRKKL